jgi:hypothetical protein
VNLASASERARSQSGFVVYPRTGSVEVLFVGQEASPHSTHAHSAEADVAKATSHPSAAPTIRTEMAVIIALPLSAMTHIRR